MKTFYFPIIGLLLILIAGGCGEIGADRGAREALERADAVLDAMPDSAMAIIAGIDTTRLNTERLRADYSLLRTMALLKTNSSAATEEGLKAAYDYYGDSDEPSRQAMLTHYAKGATVDSGGIKISEYDLSIKLAKGEYSARYQMQAWLNKSVVYAESHDGKDERECIEKGKEIILTTNDSTRIVHAYLLSGIAYNGTRQHTEALDEFNAALDYVKKYGEKVGEQELRSNIAYTYSLIGNHPRALEIFDSISSKGDVALIPHFLFAYTRSMSYVKGIDNAIAIVDSLNDKADDNTKAVWYYMLSQLHSDKGELKRALAFRDSVDKYSAIVQTEIDEKNVVRQERDIEKGLTAEIRAEADNWHKTAIIVIICLCIAMAGWYLYSAIIKKRHRKNLKEKEDALKERENSITAELEGLAQQKEQLYLENETLKKSLEEAIQKSKVLERQKDSLCRQAADLKQSEDLDPSPAINYKEENEKLHLQIRELEEKETEANRQIEAIKKERLEYFTKIHSIDASVLLKLRKNGYECTQKGKFRRKENPAPTRHNDARDEEDMQSLVARGEYIVATYRDADTLEALANELDCLKNNLITVLKNDRSVSPLVIRALIYDLCGFDYGAIGMLLGITYKHASVIRTNARKFTQKPRT